MSIAAIIIAACCLAPADQPETRVALSGEVQLARLVDLSAQQLTLDIQYEPRQLQQRVTLRLGEEITGRRLWALTNDLLAAHGLTTIRRPESGVYSVVQLQSAAGLAPVDADLQSASSGGFGSLVIRLEHISADAALDIARPLLSKPGGSATVLGSSDLLLVSDRSPRLVEITAAIDSIDAPRSLPAAVLYRPTHLPAPKLHALLNEVISNTDGSTTAEATGGRIIVNDHDGTLLVVGSEQQAAAWLTLLEQLDRPGDIERRVYPVAGYRLGEVRSLIESSIDAAHHPDFRVVADPLTRSLFITGTAAVHRQVERTLVRLEDLPHSSRRAWETWVIQNRDADELLGVLEQLVSVGAIDAGTDANRLQAAPPVLESVTLHGTDSSVSIEPPLSLAADAATNSIIAIGDPDALARIESIIADLDVRRSQVQLEILLLSLTEGDTLDLGIEIEALVRSGSISARLSSLFGLSSAGSDGRTVGDGSGFTGVVLDPGEFAVIVRALETLNEGRSLSMPRIVVADNESATLDSVVQEPFLATNASDTVATTSFGGTQDAGTTVTLRPQIAEGDHLTLEYTVSLSSFVGESSSPGIPPPRQQNSVQSVVTIPDGFTIAVGGIELVTEADAESRVPILGRLPLIGELAKSRSRSASRSRFYVFIRASVLRDHRFADLKHLSDQRLGESGIDDGWPTVTPRLIR